jgi:hypothetical protein
MAKKTAKPAPKKAKARKPRKMRTTLKDGDQVTLVIPRGKGDCPVAMKVESSGTEQRLLFVIPRARIGCSI